MSDTAMTPVGWERALMAAEKVKERLRRATKALDAAGVAYAVVGGNAVAEWVARADEGAVRNTRDVDLLMWRSDEQAVKTALASVNLDAHPRSILDAKRSERARRSPETVYLLFAQERFLPSDLEPMPSLEESVTIHDMRVVGLDALTRMKLISHRLIDRVHLRDLIGVGLIDAAWPSRLPPPLGERLQQLLDDPNG